MQLTRLKVRNIRSYASAEIALGPGTTLLTGDVGSGKTSLLYAIEMALFGFAEVDPVHLIRHRAREAEVVLGLADGEHAYELRRRFSRKSRRGKEVFEPDECVFAQDGAVQRYSPTELRQRAIDLLGFPDNPNPRAHSDLWRWAVYIPQERMRDVLSQEPVERRETVRKALGLEQYKLAADNALLLAREIANLARSLEDRADMLRHFDEDLARASTERDRTRGRLDELRSSLTDAAAARRSADLAVERAEERVRAAAADRASAERLRDEIRSMEGRQKDAELTRVDQARKVADLHREDAELARTLDGRADRIRAREAAAEVLERAVAEFNGREAARGERTRSEAALQSALTAQRRAREDEMRAEAERRGAEHRLAEASRREPRSAPEPTTARDLPLVNDALDRTREDREVLGSALAAAEPVLADLDALLSSGTCPRCHQSVDPTSFGPHRAEALSRVDEARRRLEQARADVGRLEQERTARERWERSVGEWDRAEEARRDAAQLLAGAGERFQRAVEARTTADALAVGAQAVVASLAPIGDAAPSVPLDELRKRLAESERSVEAATRAEERRAGVIHRLTELTEDATRRRAESERLDIELAVRREDLRGIEARAGGEDPEARRSEARLTARAKLERVATLDREIARGETELTGWSDRVREADAGRARRAHLLGESERERALASFLQGPFRDRLTELEERLLQRAQREFERTFARCFQTLVEDPTIAARTDGAFTPAVEIDGEWTPAEALSGGERTALALAFRIALGQVIRTAGRLRLATLILDEPTDGFSPEQVVRVGELLTELGLPQVLLVSHEGGLAAVADRVVRVAKAEGLSTVRSDGAADAGSDPAPPSPRPLAAE